MKSLDELAKIRERAQEMTRLRESQGGVRIVVGMGTCGIAAGARDTLHALMDELAKRNRQDVSITQTGCIGLCEQEPLVDVEIAGQPKVTYGRVDAEKARQIVAKHVINGQIVGEWVISQK